MFSQAAFQHVLVQNRLLIGWETGEKNNKLANLKQTASQFIFNSFEISRSISQKKTKKKDKKYGPIIEKGERVCFFPSGSAKPFRFGE